MKELNDAQRSAVIHGTGPMLVLAGPGSGKTLTLTKRISYLISHHFVSPNQILVLTFTKEAAQSMESRFHIQENKQEISPVCFGTFHSVFYNIMRKSLGNIYTILSDFDKKNLIIPIMTTIQKEKSIETTEALYDEASAIISAFSFYKNTKDMNTALHKVPIHWQPYFQSTFSRYEKARKRSSLIDFDDMVFDCHRMFTENPYLREQWQKMFTHILIDEFQDINLIQYETIGMLCPKPYNLFAVGDDDQSIYGFRGSKPELMKRFLVDYPSGKQVLLETNYRSCHEIVNTSRKIIEENHNRFSKNLHAYHLEDPVKKKQCVCVRKFQQKEEQYEYLVSCLKDLKHMGLLEECAVLFRTNLQMQGVASFLTKDSIPYSMKEKVTCIYDHFIAKDIEAYLRFAMGERTREQFLHIMNKPSRWISREALTEDNIDFRKMIQYYQYHFPSNRSRTIIEDIQRLEKDILRLSHMVPYTGVHFLRKRMGYERYLAKKAGLDLEKKQEWFQVLAWLTENAKEHSSYQEWFEYQNLFRKEIQCASKGKLNGKNGVKLMTAHASKGLEFHTVFIPDVNEGMYPHNLLEIEEERRLFYVAVTRAKEALELLAVTGSKEHPKLLSRFLNPLIPDLPQ